jgi:histidinol-phosphate/aromatic aminotransferase/cobyric acid decarboxylase-like protein
VKFPLADWIDEHEGCRYNLGESGMGRSVRPVPPSAADVRAADPRDLRRALAGSLDVDPSRVFLTHGATESNAWVVHYLVQRGPRGTPTARVRLPEYPPLVDVARAAGFRVAADASRPTLALLSNPRNPEGYRLRPSEVFAWADGARWLLVDETFREFARAPTLAEGRRGLWRSGSFTKFFGGDELRVGFLVAPEEATDEYARFHGLVAPPLSRYAIASALATWRARGRLRARVEGIWRANRTAWRRAFPRARELSASVFFDRPVRPDGRTLAERCLARSVLVCPGDLFGDPTGVRIGLTRPTFPRDLAHYLAIRDATPLRSTR